LSGSGCGGVNSISSRRRWKKGGRGEGKEKIDSVEGRKINRGGNDVCHHCKKY
jgi:hypothetical protein